MLGKSLVVFILSMIAVCANAETWRVVYNDFPPYSNTTETGQPVGFALDILQTAAASLDVEIEYIRAENPGDAIKLIAQGKADLHPHLAPNAERSAFMSFTLPYKSYQLRAYRHKNQLAPQDTVTFVGSSIGVAAGSLPDHVASALPNANVIRFQNNTELFFALAKGEVNVAFYADNAFEQLARSLGVEEDYATVGQALTTRDVSMGVSLARPEIVRILDTRLRALMDTSEYWAIHAAWFGIRATFWTSTRIALLIASVLGFSAVVALGTFIYMRVKAKTEAGRLAETNLREQTKLIDLLELRNRDLETSTRDMHEMLSVVSHDLKSPLVSISGFADMLKDAMTQSHEKPGNELAMMAIARIQSNIELMRRMIGNIFELRKLDLDNATFSSFSLNEMLDEIRIGLADSLTQENVQLVVPELGEISGDRTLIQRAFQNLIENALRHGKSENGLHMEVLKVTEGDSVLIGLRDNGSGVPSDRRRAIFELHQRLKKTGEGLGIGLAIVRRVAQSHSGDSWVEDTPGGGATFWMRFSQKPCAAMHTTKLESAA